MKVSIKVSLVTCVASARPITASSRPVGTRVGLGPGGHRWRNNTPFRRMVAGGGMESGGNLPCRPMAGGGGTGYVGSQSGVAALGDGYGESVRLSLA